MLPLILASAAFAADRPAISAPYLPGQEVHVDGALDEAAWAQATLISDFTQWRPQAGGPSPGKTEARIWYDDRHLYIGFVCVSDRPEEIRAHVMPREDINHDDQVGVYLDTFLDGRTGYGLWANAEGVQQDYRVSGYGMPNFAWDTVWTSETTRQDDGYVVEIAIDWKSLRFQRAEVQTWGIILQRKIPARGTYYAWPALDRNQTTTTSQSALLVDLRPPTRQARLELMPVLTASRVWSRDDLDQPLAPEPVDRPVDALSPGLDLRWGPTADLTLDATLNPDFSQIESDPFLLDVNTRYALYLDERRPFFLSGLDSYSDPQSTLYTRSVVDPRWGAKFSGRQQQTTLGLVSALDMSPNGSLVWERETPGFQSEDLEGKAALNTVARVRQDVGETFQVGAIYAEKDIVPTNLSDLYAYNRLGGLDLDGTFAERWRAVGSVRGSTTAKVGELAQNGWDGTVSLQRGGSAGWAGNLELSHRSADFRAETSFLTRTGVTNVGGAQRYRFERKNSATYVQPTGEVWLTFPDDPDIPPDQWYAAALNSQLGPSATLNVGGGRGGEVYDTLVNPYTYSWIYATAQPTGWLEIEASLEGGGTIAYDTVTPAATFQPGATVALRPLPEVQLDVSYKHETLWDMPSRDPRYHVNIWNAEGNLQLSRPLGVRAQVQWRDDTRDLSLAGVASWLPSPGTAAYLGYSQEIAAPDSGDGGTMERTVFGKVSWLFRV